MSIFDGKKCQEVTGVLLDKPQSAIQNNLGIDDAFIEIRCDAPAVMIVGFRDRNEGPYYMCRFHGEHAVSNRDGVCYAQQTEVSFPINYQEKK